MTMTIPVSPDGQAIALACSAIAAKGDRSLKPLTPSEWRKLSIDLHAAELRPRDLIGLPADETRETLGYSQQGAERLARLLSRGGQLAIELEGLANRGIWLLTRADENYPSALKERLGAQAPPVLFGAGPQTALQSRGIAIVGSREVDDEGLRFATALGRRCAEQDYAVFSGGARGVDLAAMTGALSHGGAAIGVTVEPLERLVRKRELRAAIADELLTLVTPFHPAARWHAGNAMRRNRMIYVLAQASVVIASSTEKGGTRAGALENLKANWVPLWVRADKSPGNQKLLAEGGRPLSPTDPADLDVADLTKDPRTTLLDTPEEEFPQAQAPGSLFEAAWPLLSPYLKEPRKEKEVAEEFELELSQARAWLKRAAEEGRLQITKRPKRYLLPEASSSQLRIDDA
jgi:DNA processing protein